MKQSFVLPVVAIFGLLLPMLVPQKTVDHQVTDNVSVTEWRPSETSALIKDPDMPRGETTAPGAAEPQGPPAMPRESPAEEDDGSYLLETASSSATMTRQGPATAIGRLHPRFVARLAGAIREARQSGLSSAGIFSAYRAPAFGVGRFLDRFNSLHAYGLAVDMSGIGGPGSNEAKLWHDIAAKHGISCPYGADNRTEWNHCQATPIKMVCPDNPLRETITAEGPIELAAMFKVGNAVIDDPPAATCVTLAANRADDADAIRPHVNRAASVAASERFDRKHLREARKVTADAFARARQSEKTRMLMVATDLRLGEKSRGKAPAEVKMREPRKAARGSEGHHEPTRHRSHVA